MQAAQDFIDNKLKISEKLGLSKVKPVYEEPSQDKRRARKRKDINFSVAIDSSKAGPSKAKKLDELEEIFLNLEQIPDKDPPYAVSLDVKFDPPETTTEELYNGIKFQQDGKGFVHVYTDGSCINNGKHTAAAGLGVYFGKDHPLNVSEPITGRPTNNVGEIQASIRAIQDAQKSEVKRLNIFTDSHFLINSVCKWMSGWKRNGWKVAKGKSVVNQIDFKRLDELIESGNMMIKWSYIPAHKGFLGNEEADRLAKLGASRYDSTKRL